MSDTLDRYRRLADDLTARVEAAPEDAWANSSPCAGWTARDVMAHVIGNARAVLVGLTRFDGQVGWIGQAARRAAKFS